MVLDLWPVLCLPCLLGEHRPDVDGLGGCEWARGCECAHPLCIARLTWAATSPEEPDDE